MISAKTWGCATRKLVNWHEISLVHYTPLPPGAIVPSGPGPPHRGFTITLKAPHSVGPLWTSDQPEAEASLPDNTHKTHNRAVHARGVIRTHNPSKQAAADLRLRPRGHRNGLFFSLKQAVEKRGGWHWFRIVSTDSL